MPSNPVQTLQRSFELLDCFTLDRPELGVREVARMTKLSSSTTGRLLGALKDAGLLRQNPSTRTYSLGSKVLQWAGVYTSSLDVHSRALASMRELSERTQETITLYILDGRERVCIERLESPQNVRITSRIGMRLPLHAGSAGKAMLAFLPPAQQEDVLQSTGLQAFTQKTMIDPASLRAELEVVRERGYAVSRGEWLLDASGVAAPIFNQTGEVIAALTISGPAQRFTDEAIQKYARLIVPLAIRISREMGYSGGHRPWEEETR